MSESRQEIPSDALVVLSDAQAQLLWEAFRPFACVRDSYGTGRAWSFDVAIPEAVIQADRRRMLELWVPLREVLCALRIHDTPSADIQLPEAVPPALRQWLDRDAHLVDPETL